MSDNDTPAPPTITRRKALATTARASLAAAWAATSLDRGTAAAEPPPAAATPSPALLVLSKGDTSLAIVDPVAMAVVGRAFAGQDPHEVVTSPDGKLAYISNYGGFGAGFHTLSLVDLVAQRPLTPIDLGPLRSPHGLAVADGKVYFTVEGSKAIGRYDPAAGKVDWVLGLGQGRTHMIVVSKDAKRIVTSNVNSDTISILEQTQGRGPGGPPPGGPPPDGGNGGPPAPPPGGQGGPGRGPPEWAETHVPVGAGPEGFDVSPDGREIWAANSHAGTVSIVDVEKKAVVATLSVPTRMANRLKFTPDGKRVFISDLGGAGVVVLDVASRKQLHRIDLGRGAAGILMQPGGARAYVASGSGVSAIDLATLAVVGHVETGRGTDGLGWAVRG
jgi:YVTN family beta-propeller protein